MNSIPLGLLCSFIVTRLHPFTEDHLPPNVRILQGKRGFWWHHVM